MLVHRSEGSSGLEFGFIYNKCRVLDDFVEQPVIEDKG